MLLSTSHAYRSTLEVYTWASITFLNLFRLIVYEIRLIYNHLQFLCKNFLNENASSNYEV